MSDEGLTGLLEVTGAKSADELLHHFDTIATQVLEELNIKQMVWQLNDDYALICDHDPVRGIHYSRFARYKSERQNKEALEFDC